MTNKPAPPAQRIDQWLWHARFFKTRTAAAKFVNDTGLRMIREETTLRISKSSTMVRPSDTLVFDRANRVRVVVILHCADRRGPASEAQHLYEDRSPAPAPIKKAPQAPFSREPGAGRPTKKDRRALNAVRALDDI